MTGPLRASSAATSRNDRRVPFGEHRRKRLASATSPGFSSACGLRRLPARDPAEGRGGEMLERWRSRESGVILSKAVTADHPVGPCATSPRLASCRAIKQRTEQYLCPPRRTATDTFAHAEPQRTRSFINHAHAHQIATDTSFREGGNRNGHGD